jgi:hypothetical protein
MAANQQAVFPAGFSCSKKQVLNKWEQTLYNVCEEYFYSSQDKYNRHPVLSQVRLCDAITVSPAVIENVLVPETVVENITVPEFEIELQLYAMSLDILITNGPGYPQFIFEADGKYHDKPTGLDRLSEAEATKAVRKWAKQVTRDKYKNAVAKKAGIPLFRVKVDGSLTHLEVVHAEAVIDGFQRDLPYPRGDGVNINYSEPYYPNQLRLIEAADLEVCLIRAQWAFPERWKFVTNYENR